MKKLSLALAVTSALGASAANAAIVSEFGNAVLVPWTHFDGEGRTTTVGLTSCAAGTVYWTFFNENSLHLRDDRFGITENEQLNFAWSEVGGAAFEDEDGYLLLVLDTAGPLEDADNDPATDPVPGAADGRLGSTDSACLAANAFYVDPVADDVSFIPAVPLNWAWNDFLVNGDARFNVGIAEPNVGYLTRDLLDLGPDDVKGLWAGSKAGETLYMRYLKNDIVDNEEDTRIVTWSVGDVGPGSGNPNDTIEYVCETATGGFRDVPVRRYTVFQYGTNQNAGPSVNLELQYTELNIMDVEITDTCDAWEAGFGAAVNFMDTAVDDGFILWRNIPADLLSFSIVSSNGFSATQTLINPSRVPHMADGTGTFEDDERFNIFERYNPEGDNPYDGLGDAFGPGGDDDTPPYEFTPGL